MPVVAVAAAGAVVLAVHLRTPHPSAPASTPPKGSQTAPAAPTSYSAQHPVAAWPDPLPYPVVIADPAARRLEEVTPGGQVVWTMLNPAIGPVPIAPSDVSFTAHGGHLVITAESQNVVARANYLTHAIQWWFGVPGQSGAGTAHLNFPDDGAVLPDGDVAVADVRNCREVIINPAGQVSHILGNPQTGYCQTHVSLAQFGYPNGSQPQPNGDILLTFGSGDKVALVSPSGKVVWSAGSPDLYGGFVSDAQLTSSGDVVVCGYGNPGSVVAFNPQTGAELWHYFVASGSGALNDPTQAVPLPNGDVLVADGGNHRIVVINPTQGKIVWQYSTGLQAPDGLALDLYHNWQTPATSSTPK